MNIKTFVLNPFRVNTYIVSDDTKECIIVDASCQSSSEENRIASYISKENLKPVALITTHTHIDHIIGNQFIFDTYNLLPQIHKQGLFFLDNVGQYAMMMGADITKTPEPKVFLNHNDIISFGNTKLKVLYTPGHADGSICLYSELHKKLFTGDVIFNLGIGRTDLATGNFDLLIESINNNILTLPDETEILPGHGYPTTVGNEIQNNPFIN